ncbi:PAAR-like protein [Flavobacterium sp. LBUM151]
MQIRNYRINFSKFRRHGFKIEDKNLILDRNVNICDFIFCSLHKKAYEFQAVEKKWKNTANSGTTGGKYITTKSVLLCKQEGLISIVNSGQDCVIEEAGMLKIVDLE